MAPECFKKKEVDGNRRYPVPTFKSDIWSLGALLVELLTAQSLYEDAFEMSICKYQEKMPKTFEKLPHFSKEILKKCFVLKTEERPTAKELLSFFQQKDSVPINELFNT